MVNVLFVGVGGFLGAILRFIVSGYVQSHSASGSFPIGTLAVNFLGCLLLAALSAASNQVGGFSPESRSLLFIGLLGAFTTFSTFSLETFTLFQDGKLLSAGFNVFLNITVCIFAVWMGREVVSSFWG